MSWADRSRGCACACPNAFAAPSCRERSRYGPGLCRGHRLADEPGGRPDPLRGWPLEGGVQPGRPVGLRQPSAGGWSRCHRCGQPQIVTRVAIPASAGGSSDEAISPDGKEIWLGMPTNGRTTTVLNTETCCVEAVLDTGPRTNHPNFVSVGGV